VKKATAIIMICILAIAVAGSIRQQPREWTYTLMGAQVNYSVGERVTDRGQIFECIQWDESSPLVIVPPAANPAWWAEVE